MKKIHLLVFVFASLLFIPSNVSAKETKEEYEKITPKGPACLYARDYINESVVTTHYDVQFTHITERNSVITHVERYVTTTESLSVSGGFESEIRMLLADAKANFEMTATGSRQVTVKVTWGPIPANEVHILEAGKVIQKDSGYIGTRYTDCSTKRENVSLTGSTSTFHRSRKQ